MREYRNLLQILLFTAALCIVHGRKYDIEDESLKLYGQNLQSSIKSFRRTPDYLKILQDKMDELNAHLSDVSLQTVFHYSNKIVERCKKAFPEYKEETTPAGGLQGARIRNGHDNMIQTFPFPKIPELRTRKNEEDHRSPVEVLDSYGLLSSALTLQERNFFRDIGFEYAGHIIHTIIKSMGADDAAMKSTKLPYQGDRPVFSSTTEHKHEIHPTEELAQSTMPPEQPPVDDTFKYKYRARSKNTRLYS